MQRAPPCRTLRLEISGKFGATFWGKLWGMEVLEGAALRGISTQGDSLKEDFTEAVSGSVSGNDPLGSPEH